MFSGSDLREGLRLGTEAGCFGTFDWIDEEDMENPVIWIAFANGKPVGYAGGHKATSGRSRFILSIICSKKNVTGCGNIGTHLMYQVEKEARRLGASYIELSSVVDAIRFYTRTGFVRADDPCASKEDKERADSRAKALFDKKVKKYIAEGLTIPESWHIYNGRFYPKEDRIISSSAVVLKKCIRKKKTST
jgi:GNAT superfamily N-acetyltransferase